MQKVKASIAILEGKLLNSFNPGILPSNASPGAILALMVQHPPTSLRGVTATAARAKADYLAASAHHVVLFYKNGGISFEPDFSEDFPEFYAAYLPLAAGHILVPGIAAAVQSPISALPKRKQWELEATVSEIIKPIYNSLSPHVFLKVKARLDVMGTIRLDAETIIQMQEEPCVTLTSV